MASLKLEVDVLEVSEVYEVGSKGFKKRDLICKTVEDNEKYCQTFKVEFVQDKVGILDAVLPGTKVSVSINVRGNTHQKDDGTMMYFTQLQGWKVELA